MNTSQKTWKVKPSSSIAIHDITPANYSKMAPLVDLLRECGWQKIQMAVVPGKDEVSEAFAQWCKGELAKGAEFWVHGFVHKAEVQNRVGIIRSRIQKSVNFEAEFYGIDAKTQLELLKKALESWQRQGLPQAVGFVPPTWHAEKELLHLCLQRGLAYEGRLQRRFTDGNKHLRFPISFPVGEKNWKNSLKVGAWLLRFFKRSEIVLHPIDFESQRRNDLVEWLQRVKSY